MSWSPFSFLRRSRNPIRHPSERRAHPTVEVLETRLAPATNLTGQPAVGANLDSIVDWSRADVFVDVMKQARQFTSLSTGQAATVGANGWPTQDFEAILQTGFVGAASLYDGTYSLSFTGQATVDTAWSPSGSAVTNAVYNAATNTTTANVTLNANNGAGGWYFVLDFHNVNSVSNVKVIRPGYAPNTKQIFTNEFLAEIQPYTALRFMDWERTNGNPVVNWSDRSQATAPEQSTSKGVAWEYVINLANVTGKDIWINIPEGVTDDYVKQLATLLKSNLDPGIHVYVEYSNELWNTQFSQTTANLNAAVAEVQAGLNSGTPSNLMYAGETAKNSDNTYVHQWDWAYRRTARTIMSISNDFASIWGSSAINNEVRPVLASQVVNPWIIQTQLQYLQQTFGAPDLYLYAIAGAPYFNLNGDHNSSLTVDEVLADFTASIQSFQTYFAQYAHWATFYGLHDLAYEGGEDTTGSNDVTVLAQASMDARMQGIVTQYLDQWFSADGGLFMWYFAGASDYSSPYGMWGVTDSITNLNSPKMLGIEAVQNAAAPAQSIGTAIPGSVSAVNYFGSTVTSQAYLPQQANNSYFDYLVQAPSAGSYALTLAYAANSPAQQLEVIVNDQVVQVLTLAATGPDHDSQWAPTDFSNATPVTLSLNQGLNVVRLMVVQNGYYSLKSLSFSTVSGNHAPTVATPASASGLTATSANLAVLGADDSGEANLTYNWSVANSPTGAPAPTFSSNGTNASKNATVTFGASGTYLIAVSIRDAAGLTTTSTVSVTIGQIVTSIRLAPGAATVNAGATLQLVATALDQFGKAMATQPVLTWTASAGTVSSAGLFTAPGSGSTGVTVGATSKSVSGSATLTIAQALPTGWTDSDIGTPGLAGSAGASSGTITVTGGGGDIWGTADQFNFAYQTLTGDGTIIAQVASLQNTDPWAKAGVMIRATTASSATFADVVLSAGNGVHFQYRSTTSGNAIDVAGPSITAPAWLKLVRSGTTLTGYVSTDGVNWTQIGTISISMAATVDIGLAVTAHNNSLLSTATFTSVSVSTPTANQPPTVAAAAHVASSTPTSVTLSVVGADNGGASNLNYTWSVSGPGTVTFSANGTNAAQNVTATFSQSGSYTFHVTIKDTNGLTASATDPGTMTAFVVSQAFSSLTVTPGSVNLLVSATQQFSATGKDQFGNAMAAAVTWSVSGGGTITSAGLYAAPAAATNVVVSATNGSVSGAAAVSVAAPASGNPSYASGFTTSGLALNGGAVVKGSQLQLTNGGTWEAASAYYATPVSVAPFTSSFDFQLTNATADGFTFILQGDGPTAVGSSGGGLGSQGLAKSVAVKFDLFNNAGEGINSTGLYINGAAPMSVGSVNLAGTGIDLHSGDVFRVGLSYDGTMLAVTITDTKTGASATQRYAVNIAQAVGGSTAYAGFTAGTGGAAATQNIIDWNYTNKVAVSYTNGFTTSGLALNGGAVVKGSQLQLTNGGTWEAASAYYATPVSVAPFTSSFDFQLTNATADGFTFILQGDGPTAVGSSGGGLGSQGLAKSVAVKFDLFNNAGEGINSTGLYINGAAPMSVGSVNLAGTGIDLHSGDVFRVGLSYDGTMLAVTITDTKTGASATQRYAVNIAQAVGGSTAYAGFTAGTGGAAATQDILDWTFNPL